MRSLPLILATLILAGVGTAQEKPVKKSHGPLVVAAGSGPEMLSPATALSPVECQALDLLFEPLVRSRLDPRFGRHYVSALAARLPARSYPAWTFPLRPNAAWSDGTRVSAGDVRHTAQLLDKGGLSPAWGELFDPPRWGNDPFAVEIPLHQGIFDPLAWAGFHVLPQQFRGKPLARADDPEFAKEPIGTGPFRVTRRQEMIVLERYPRSAHETISEIRFVSWRDQKKWAEPLPHVVLDLTPDQVPQLRQAGYRDIRTLLLDRAHYLAVNHRRPALANLSLRRFLALALDREQLLKENFAAEVAPVSMNGLFPRNHWAACPPPRVPQHLHQPELARSLAKSAAKELGPVKLTLKFPDDNPRLARALEQAVRSWRQIAQDAGFDFTCQLVPLTTTQMRQAIQQRDFDLLYYSLDQPASLPSFWPLFDPRPEARAAGGSNLLGYDNDAKLLSLIRKLLQRRQFAAVQEGYHNLHVHLAERMPVVPLWQLPQTVAFHPSLTVGDLDPDHIFADILTWNRRSSEPSKSRLCQQE